MPMSPRLLRPIASGVHPEAAAWRSAVVANGGSVSASTMKAVSDFCAAIDAAGIRDRFYRLNLFAGTKLNAALVPLYRGPTFGGTTYGNATDTNNGPFVSGDYSETGASGGLVGNGTSKYLNTGLAQNVLTADSRHLAAYEILRTTATFDAILGSDNGANVSPWYLGSSSNANKMSYIATSAFTSIDSAAYDGGGMWIGVSSSSTSFVLYKNGSSDASGSFAAATPGSANTAVFANLREGSPTNYSAARVGGYSIGLSMDSTQAASYYSAMQAFQTALGRNV